MKRLLTEKNIRIYYGILAVIEFIIIYYTVWLSENRMITVGHFLFCIVIEFLAFVWFLYKAKAFIWQTIENNEEEK